MRIHDDQAHLSYCSNIQPGQGWAATRENVLEHFPAVKAGLGVEGPFGVGLRLSAAAADELGGAPAQLERFAAELEARGLYVFTINGFPHGRFHAGPVKQAVYRPDWREPERLHYTEVLISILARLLPAGIEGSISTVPGGFRADTRDPGARELIAEHLLRCAASLWRRREAEGKLITLALEPEPCCMLETTSEAVAFFGQHLLGRAGVARMAALTGLGPARAELALRRHLGVCVDACHAAVEFEHPGGIVARLRAAGLRLAKLQIAAGLRVEPVSEAALAALQAFDDPVYLHQVVARVEAGGELPRLRRYVDLPEAFATRERESEPASEWRVHYHVPVFAAELPPLRTTNDFARALLREVLAAGLCSQLEVETYTWSLLPTLPRGLGLTDAIVRELRWVLEQCADLEPRAS